MTESGSNQKRNGNTAPSRRLLLVASSFVYPLIGRTFSRIDQRRIPASYSTPSARLLLSSLKKKNSKKIFGFFHPLPPPPASLPPSCLPAYKSLLHYSVLKSSRRMGRIPCLHLLFIWRGCAHTCVWSGIHQRAQLDQHFPTDSMIGPCSNGRYDALRPLFRPLFYLQCRVFRQTWPSRLISRRTETYQIQICPAFCRGWNLTRATR